MRAGTKSPEEARRLTPVPIGGRPGGWRGRNLNDGWFPFCREFWGSDTDGAAAEPVLRGRFQQKPPTHDNGPVSRCRPGEYDYGGREPLTNEGKDGRRKEKPERRKGGAGRRCLPLERRAAPSPDSGEGAGVCRRGRKASRAFHGAFSQGKQTKRSVFLRQVCETPLFCGGQAFPEGNGDFHVFCECLGFPYADDAAVSQDHAGIGHGFPYAFMKGALSKMTSRSRISR